MKHLGILLTGVLTLFVILVVAVFTFMTEELPPQGVIVVPVDPTITRMEEALVEQEAAYQAQLNEIEQSMQQRQTELRNQLESLNNEIFSAGQQLTELSDREKELSSQLQQLEVRRAKQLATYQTTLQQSRDEYLARQAQLQGQLEAAQAELDQVEAELER